MRQVFGLGALGWPRGIRWRGRWEGGLGWGIHVTPWLIHVNVWQNPLQCCEVVSLQLIIIIKKNTGVGCYFLLQGIFPAEGLNPLLLPWQADSLPLSHLGIQYIIKVNMWHTCYSVIKILRREKSMFYLTQYIRNIIISTFN